MSINLNIEYHKLSRQIYAHRGVLQSSCNQLQDNQQYFFFFYIVIVVAFCECQIFILDSNGRVYICEYRIKIFPPFVIGFHVRDT